MNAKERMTRLFAGEPVGRVPVAPHWWGMYKFQLAGLADNYGEFHDRADGRKMDLADVDELFFKTYAPDWFHLGGGDHKQPRDPYRLKKADELLDAVRRLESKPIIEEYLDLACEDVEELKRIGTYDHVKKLADTYGDTEYIMLNEGNPIGSILDPHGLMGFEHGLVSLIEEPEYMEYMIYLYYEKQLERIKVLQEYGCHAYIGSETLCSPDLISPETYRMLILPAQRDFYIKTREMGIEPIAYFLGDVLPLMNDINQMGITGLMVEESKKTFVVDVVEIRKKLAPDITLFGNLDGVEVLLHGSCRQVESETLRQLQALRYGRFAMNSGSPVAFDTPSENIHTMIRTARNYVL